VTLKSQLDWLELHPSTEGISMLRAKLNIVQSLVTSAYKRLERPFSEEDPEGKAATSSAVITWLKLREGTAQALLETVIQEIG